jgi:hypothetical protein
LVSFPWLSFGVVQGGFPVAPLTPSGTMLGFFSMVELWHRTGEVCGCGLRPFFSFGFGMIRYNKFRTIEKGSPGV